MKRFIDRVNSLLAIICAWLLLILTFMLVYDCISRGAPSFFAWLSRFPGLGWTASFSDLPFLQPVHVITDVSVMVMIMGVYLGLGYCEQLGEHVRLEVLGNLLKGRARAILHWTAWALQFATVAVMLYCVYRNTLRSVRTEEASPGVVPFIIWPAKVVVCIGIFFYLLQLLGTAQDMWNARKSIPREIETDSYI